jgi:uncharacterized membrane protein SpoIIM required for sporulation
VSAQLRELRLKSRRFRDEREGDWRRLERLLEKAESGSLRSLSEDEVVSLTVLYRSALSSLSVARATALDHQLIDYLESLATRAYFFVYGARTNLVERLARFFARDWPAAAQALWRETLASALIGVIGVATAWLLVASDPDWYYAFVPGGLSGGRDPSATTAFLKSTLHHSPTDPHAHEFLSALSTYLFTHNAGIALGAFAFGFAFCLPTLLLLLQNGLMLGAFLALYSSRGLGVDLGGWLFIHGVTELWAITIAGAAGFRIGLAVAFPGTRSRVEAAGAAGRQAAILMCGVVVMLFVAGLLEGFARQLIDATWARYTIAALTAVLWGVYLYAPRRTAPEAAHG